MRLRHICEACGRNEVLDSDEAYSSGWDYPPRMGVFGVLSPRTCPDCTIDKTLYWRCLLNDMKCPSDLSDAERAFLVRVIAEPESIQPD